jgi:hypothetical protein
MSIIVTTFPRSGSHFLKKHINENFYVDENFIFTHDMVLKESNNLITIVRNPKDAISSLITMNYHYRVNNKSFQLLSIDKEIMTVKIRYYKYYQYLLNSNVDIIIDYNFLNTNIDQIIDHIGKKLNLKRNNKNIEFLLNNETESKHLITSKESMHYEQIKTIVNQQKFDIQDQLYKEVLSKSFLNLKNTI